MCFGEWIHGFHAVDNTTNVVGERRLAVVGLVEQGSRISYSGSLADKIGWSVGEFSDVGRLSFLEIVEDDKVVVKSNEVQLRQEIDEEIKWTEGTAGQVQWDDTVVASA